ncbi:hypothetical protein Tco_0193765 [Tanacetum coccineum]
MGDNGPLRGYSCVLENLAGEAWHDFDYMGMEVDESLASNLPSSYEAYQGDFLIMVRDLDVTPRTQVMFFKNVRVLMSSASTFASQMLGGRFSLPIILGLVSYDREWPRISSIKVEWNFLPFLIRDSSWLTKLPGVSSTVAISNVGSKSSSMRLDCSLYLLDICLQSLPISMH